MIAVDLLTSEQETLTTDNREELFRVQNAGPIIVAISMSGYCHVWNLDTQETSSFRLPSVDCWQILINGTKVVLEYEGYVVHWCSNTEIARTIPLEDDVVALAPHPSEDEITMVHFVPQEEKHHSDPDTPSSPIYYSGMIYQLRKVIQSASKHESDRCAPSSRSDPVLRMPFPKQYMNIDYTDGILREISSGQASVIDRLQQVETYHRMSAWVSVEPDGVVAIHTFPCYLEFSQLLCPERGILYATIAGEEHGEFVILKAKTMPSPSNTCVWYDYSVQRREDLAKHLRIYGDARFFVFLFEQDLEIWAMDESTLRTQKFCETMKSLKLVG